MNSYDCWRNCPNLCRKTKRNGGWGWVLVRATGWKFLFFKYVHYIVIWIILGNSGNGNVINSCRKINRKTGIETWLKNSFLLHFRSKPPEMCIFGEMFQLLNIHVSWDYSIVISLVVISTAWTSYLIIMQDFNFVSLMFCPFIFLVVRVSCCIKMYN